MKIITICPVLPDCFNFFANQELMENSDVPERFFFLKQGTVKVSHAQPIAALPDWYFYHSLFPIASFCSACSRKG